MSKLRLLFRLAPFCLVLSGFASLGHATDVIPPTVALIPRPVQMVAGSGSFLVQSGAVVAVPDEDAATLRTANYFAGLLQRTRGLALSVRSGTPRGTAIELRRDPHATVANPEGYVLDVTPQGVSVTARTEAGLFYGAMTLWQLLTPDDERGEMRLPALHIEDEPRFVWRGVMLDVARHFTPPAEIERLLDQMAQHKLNTFHWHLTDDQGWRIEIKRYPELTRIGAWRTPPGAGKEGEPKRYGGFYTQDEIRHIVAYAAERQITVVPEIDLPGHAQAAIAAYPQLGVTGKRPTVSTDWGVNPYLYNANEPTLRFVENVLDEVMALFPSRYIHLGGDEAIKDQWKASPAIQARMRALGVKDENALQSWFINQLGQYLAEHDRRLVGWDEILEGGLPASATVMSWRGTKGAIEAAKQGHDVVLSPSPELYFDHVQSDRDDDLTGRLPPITLASVYGFEAVPAELDPSQAKHVLGLQANVWTEHLPTFVHVQHALMPRLDALAEAAWSPVAMRNWDGFLTRLPAQLARYRLQDVHYADSAFAPAIELDRNAALANGTAHVTMASQARVGSIHYTLDGSAPGLNSPHYSQPFDIKLPVTIKAANFYAHGGPLPMSAPRERVLDRAHLLSRNSGELPNCPGSDFTLRVQPMPDATSLAPAYNLNVFDSCRMFRAAPLDDIASIRVDVARLANNYALADDAKLVVSRKARTAHGELVVYRDRCDGPKLADLPLPAGGTSSFTLSGPLAKAQGAHDLCLVFTAPAHGPLYAIGQVSLVPEERAP
ncbi:family 20 glycosylhydrolase [Dyella subtropica]|uniref:family 20 glycosylhydrolase n=1 Tax=Dyella subtropica TaxID=2992127 RepID=UPI00224CBA51|nr:family 20 glycosylhydrolase [Dyella subtropica]